MDIRRETIRAVSSKVVGFALAAITTVLVPRPAHAWLLHEHARISAMGVSALDDREKETLRAAWTLARTGSPAADRLCAEPIQEHPIAREAGSPVCSWCVGYNALPALAADHSCRPADFLELLTTSAFTQPLLVEAARMEAALEHEGGSILRRIDERRVHDITLQLLDEQYLTRAKAVGTHFQLTRHDSGERRPGEGKDDVLRQYLARALSTGQETNATALYVNYHAAALQIAASARALCSRETGLCERATSSVWDALMAEAFALHFLEDAFSAGHFVGAWGDTSQRFGTHDYYSRNGVGAVTFDGDTYTANGDLFLKDVDARRAAHAVATSLRQVLNALRPGPSMQADAERSITDIRRAFPAHSFDVCAEQRVPSGLESLAGARFIQSAVREWPMPSLRSPEVPRFRAEVGLFFGASLSGDVGLSADVARTAVAEARIRPALRAGYGLEGAMSRYMDGRFFIEIVGAGVVSSFDVTPRLGVGARVHLPFAVFPGDGLLAPFAAIGWKPAVWIARQAALGSVYGFERPLLLGEESTLQITLGRDATFLFYPATKAETVRRYELLLSVVDVTIGRAYSQQVANEVGLQLGFQMMLSKGDKVGRTYGGYLSVSTGSRVYP